MTVVTAAKSAMDSADTAWMYVYSFTLYFSFFAATLATYHMRKLGGDVFRSTVRFVITCFLVCTALHALAGGAFYTFLLVATNSAIDEDEGGDDAGSGSSAIDSLLQADHKADGGEAAYITKLTHSSKSLSFSLTGLLLLENLFFILSAYWILLLTRELFKLAMRTVDRGSEDERKMIQKYVIYALVIIAMFLAAGLTIIIVHDGYNKAYKFLSITEQIVLISAVFFSTAALIKLRCSGRKHEHIHGVVMASPLYRRLKLLMIVCAVFTLPYCFLQLSLLNVSSNHVDAVPDFLVGIFTMLYYMFGAAQAVVMGGSQQCCLRILSPIIPTHIRASPEWHRLRATRRHDSYLGYEATAPPTNPVFVNTDIESSSALWATAPDDVIDAAQQIHDDLLRSLLPKYGGYEITTAGDAFQLAFHTIREAVDYCLEVQLQLVQAKWPSALDGLVVSTKTEWAIGLKPQAIFRGIRVRMGVHDTNSDEEGKLVMQTHPVTGKTLYIGASELIGREIGDVGFGGQIIVSKRVASWLQTNEKLIHTPFLLDYTGTHEVHQLELDIELYEVTPKILEARRKVFRKRRGIEESKVVDDRNTDAGESSAEDSSAEYRSQRTPTGRIIANLSAALKKF